MSSDKLLENLNKLKDEHEKQLDKIRTKINEIDTIPKAKALVGKCFKYRNGHFFGAYKKGWVFKHIIATDGIHLLVDMFETDGPDKVDFSFNRAESPSYFTHSSLVQITLKEYNIEFKKMIAAIVKFNKRKMV